MSNYKPPKTAREASLLMHEYLFNDEPINEEIDQIERIILRLIEEGGKQWYSNTYV